MQKPLEVRKFAIVFVDMVGSSNISKIKNHREYFKLIRDYHKCVEDVRDKYLKNKFKLSFFPEPRGDEGVFIFGNPIGIQSDIKDERTILDAINFSILLKFIWLMNQLVKENFSAHNLIDLAVGIHFDELAYSGPGPLKIDEIEGYAINYAKRIESASRIGKHSNIFISEEARALISEKNNIFFERYDGIILKGLNDNETVYEVKNLLINEKYLLTLNAVIQQNKNNLFSIRNKLLLNWIDDILMSFYYTKIVLNKDATTVSDLKGFLDNIKNKNSNIVKFISCIHYKDIILSSMHKKNEKFAAYMYLIKELENILKQEKDFYLVKLTLLKCYKELIKNMLKDVNTKLKYKELYSYIVDLDIHKMLSEKEKKDLLDVFAL